ncbi:hypothetical protein [Pseudosulfitobacter koreensis]|uniref:Beta/Gamma crystallin n=1 Tax=Pseudosulfitobacter koreensis TaxID=2968472 RepID=A0ABT1Z2I1_9RHOB|nr:hypothetical protein [Pseudosulfitobacter koreense]MCR8827318.1 hypothetical protein [Pseudosulfitobacter koreense]
MKTLFNLTALTMTAALSLASVAMAADEYNVTNGLTLTGNPLGLHGVDPVSMIDSEAPRMGDAVYTSAHDGVDCWFSLRTDPVFSPRFDPPFIVYQRS